jgi:transcription-repair coupling factor (superfamily II helicase)
MAETASLPKFLAESPYRANVLGRPRGRGKPHRTLQNVTAAAHAPVAAALALSHPGRTWLVFPNSSVQEKFYPSLEQWLPNPLFMPDEPASPIEGALPDPSATAERLRVIEQLGREPTAPECVVMTRLSFFGEIINPANIVATTRKIAEGESINRDALLKELSEAGYELVAQISERGQIAIRGGIMDIFSFQESRPVRLEFFGDEVESIRGFDLDAQMSIERLSCCAIQNPVASLGDTCALSSLVSSKDRVVFSDAFEKDSALFFEETQGAVQKSEVFFLLQGGAPDSAGKPENYDAACFETGLSQFNAGDFIIDEQKRERFFAQLAEWHQESWTVFLFCLNEGESERLRELIPDKLADRIAWRQEFLAGGFTCPAAKAAVLGASELLGSSVRTQISRRRSAAENIHRTPINFSELIEGELVVHLEHGIARFEELRDMPRDGGTEQVLVLSFANQAKLYVPLEQSGMVSRYVGIGRKNPPLSVLGDGKWDRARKNAEKAVFSYAARLLALHAERDTNKGYAFPPDSHWGTEFEAAFPYTETPDQLTAIAETKEDMESERPMDRLICGDVGFGKTEVAIRAAFKAVMGGKQVAMLVPTTVLAEQHYRNFRERMSAFPVTVEMLSRFRSSGEQRAVVEGLSNGSVDIVIGTHRLLSSQVHFKDLGLVVIDEEQRFGVLHKERLKERFRLVDLLTLSATPIPRTLYMSLMGAKDMSTLETPPPNRFPVETFVCPYDERLIRDAIQREMARGGQVYFLHNRIESIERVKTRIQQLVPKARILIGHGRMPEDELEEVMHAFVSGKADVLISTTIIESGLDIPNANTILIDRADRFGLSDLYQLRGRVGRSDHKAYAYLLLPRSMLTVGEARKRINAIKQYSSLGAGFKIALRDLEIRGAGNILGTQQSGHVIAIGFDLYCSMLRQAIAKYKGEVVDEVFQSNLSIDFVCTREVDFIHADSKQKAAAFLPLAYINDSATRIAAYRALSSVKSDAELQALAAEWRDRFGSRPPEAVLNLLTLASMKLCAASKRFNSVETKQEKVMLQRNGELILIGNRFPRLPLNSPPNERLQQLLGILRSL